MRASKIYLRWYRSFNTRFYGYEPAAVGDAPWDSFKSKPFPLIQIPLDRQITTVVGANESGKSHLLSAIAKVFTGHGIAEGDSYAIHDICRYCAFEGLDERLWPNIGVELTFDTPEEYDTTLKAMGLSRPASEDEHEPRKRCTIILNGPDSANFASVYAAGTMAQLGSLSREKWNAAYESSLPALRFIDANVALANEVHVGQLISLYEEKESGNVYDPLTLQDLAEAFADLRLEEGKAPAAAAIAAVSSIRNTLQKARMGLKGKGRLELQLFRDVLKIPLDTLQQVSSLSKDNRGYVERLVSQINHRLDEALDLTHFWEQDDQFRLSVDYKSGFFYFEITDKTGAKYTFNERSSGLRFFLSYYIQAKAIEQHNSKRGSIVLMDEPDSFLSSVGQRNLLQVFDSLVSNKAASGTCQLVYTTHSPFLINRNFPKRVVLVRKGEGSEGTQFVPRSSVRRYEPIRSALGVDCAETLFMGATNVVVEGITDQRVLIAAIQKFGEDGDIDRFLNLNKVTFVSAGGAPNVRRLVEKSTAGDERRPIVVVMLDGDASGNDAYQSLTSGNILDKAFVTTIDQVGIPTPWTQRPIVFEDALPPSLLAASAKRCLKERWSVDIKFDDFQAAISADDGHHMAERLVRMAKTHLPPGTQVSDEELKTLILDSFADFLAEDDAFDGAPGLADLEAVTVAICKKLQLMIDAAERRSQRESMQKCVRLVVSDFDKSHHHGASRADIDRCLNRLEGECGGFTQEARDARDNVTELREILTGEVAEARDRVDMTKWLERLSQFSQCPWKKPAKNQKV